MSHGGGIPSGGRRAATESFRRLTVNAVRRSPRQTGREVASRRVHIAGRALLAHGRYFWGRRGVGTGQSRLSQRSTASYSAFSTMNDSHARLLRSAGAANAQNLYAAASQRTREILRKKERGREREQATLSAGRQQEGWMAWGQQKTRGRSNQQGPRRPLAGVTGAS